MTDSYDQSCLTVRRLAELIPRKRDELQKFQKAHANKHLDNVTVGQAIGGARS